MYRTIGHERERSLPQLVEGVTDSYSVGIAGAGSVGQALGRHLREGGIQVAAVASRSRARASSAAKFIGGNIQSVAYEELAVDRVIIAVPDRAMIEVARRFRPAAIVLHTSGAISGLSLRDAVGSAENYGSLHPLQTFPTPEDGYRTLPGCAFGVDGEPAALRWATEIVKLLDGFAIEIPVETRSLYHAAAVMASNHLTAVMDAAIETMLLVGIDLETARRAMTNISRAALENTLRAGAVAALTGPVVRGDAETVARHIAALRVSPATIQQLYRAAARHALEIARRGGLPPESIETVRMAIGSDCE